MRSVTVRLSGQLACHLIVCRPPKVYKFNQIFFKQEPPNFTHWWLLDHLQTRQKDGVPLSTFQSIRLLVSDFILFYSFYRSCEWSEHLFLFINVSLLVTI